MDTSLMSGWMVCYINYDYLGTILNGSEFNDGVMKASDFYKPTHLYIKTDSEETTAKINKWLETQDRVRTSIMISVKIKLKTIPKIPLKSPIRKLSLVNIRRMSFRLAPINGWKHKTATADQLKTNLQICLKI